MLGKPKHLIVYDNISFFVFTFARPSSAHVCCCTRLQIVNILVFASVSDEKGIAFSSYLHGDQFCRIL